MDLEGFIASPVSPALAARRERLARALGPRPALLAAGVSRPRNYAGNAFAFRAVSHFLYFFGLPLPGAYALWDGGQTRQPGRSQAAGSGTGQAKAHDGWTLFLPPPEPDGALWHGPEPTPAEIGEALGVRVRSTDELAAALPPGTATVPAPDLETNRELGTLLGRQVAYGVFAGVDEPLADAIIALRLAHDDAAQAELRLAADATAEAHAAGMRATRPGLRESAVRAAMEAALIARGMTVAYGSIVTVHGEVLHSHVHHHVLGPRDLLLADVGAETAGGWAGDVTRTWPVTGTYSPTQRDLYDVVLAAQTRTIEAVRPGVRYRDLHLLAAKTLAEGLVALGILRGDPAELVADGVAYLLFPHGIGHLLGLDVHDMEDLGDRAGYASDRKRGADFGIRYLRLDRDLIPGMAVTIEPGLYIVPGILADPVLAAKAGDRLDRRRLAQFDDVRGIRIEDDVLVTAAGHDVLTKAIPKTRAAVETAMRS